MANTEINQTLSVLETVCPDNYPTLKAIAAALDVPQQRIYSVAKQPKAGEVYDANVYNWDAIDRFIQRRLDADKGIATVADVINQALALDLEFKTNDRRKGVRATTKANITLADGSSIPARKKEIAVGDLIMLRKDKKPEVFTVVMLTETHAVLQVAGSPELSCYSNWTANQQFMTDASQFDEICAKRQAELDKVNVSAESEAANTPNSEDTTIG